MYKPFQLKDGRFVSLIAGGSEQPVGGNPGPIGEPPVTNRPAGALGTPASAAPPGTITIPVPPTPVAPAPTNGQTFTAADLEAARKQEKDKLYGRLEDLSTRLKSFETEREKELREAAEAKTAAEAAAEAARQQELGLADQLAETNATWEQRFRTLTEEREAEKAVIDRERHYQAMKEHRDNRVAEESERIAPQLRDLIRVEQTPEAIEAQIVDMIKRTDAILSEVAAAQQGQRAAMRGSSVTAPPTGPADTETAHKTYSAQEIAAMPWPEYEKIRGSLLRAASDQYRGQ